VALEQASQEVRPARRSICHCVTEGGCVDSRQCGMFDQIFKYSIFNMNIQNVLTSQLYKRLQYNQLYSRQYKCLQPVVQPVVEPAVQRAVKCIYIKTVHESLTISANTSLPQAVPKMRCGLDSGLNPPATA